MNTPTLLSPPSKRPQAVSLFLRSDGSLMLVQGDKTVELALSPQQLLQLGTDALRLASTLQPECMLDVVAVLESTVILQEVAPCVN